MVLDSVAAIQDHIIGLRRHFHQHPELSFRETLTAAKIIEELKKLPVSIQSGLAAPGIDDLPGTGIVATLKGAYDGPCIALRADMDALPVEEKTELKFKSSNDNVMHACGHDGHMASLLGAAKVLADQKDQLRGSVKFIFQPAEEYGGGAKFMIQSGCLDGVDEIYGIHLWSSGPVGEVHVVEGTIMASVDTFEITITGKGGHGAMPHETVDPIMIQAQLISAAQTIVSRNISPCQCGVVTFGQVANAGVASNVIPTDLTLFGTTRAFRIEERDLIRSRLRKLCEGFSIAFEAEISVKFHVDGLRAAGYPPTVNHKSEYQKVVAAAAEVVGEKKVTPGSLPTMAAEDFSYFLQKCKGCFFMVGAGKPDGVPRPHHSSYFDIDEKSLLISASVFVKIVENSLINKSSNSNSAGTPTCTATSSCCE